MNIGGIHYNGASYYLTGKTAGGTINFDLGRTSKRTAFKEPEEGVGGLQDRNGRTPVSLQEIYRKEVGVSSVNLQNVKDVTTDNYQIKADEDGKLLRIYDKEGNSLGAFAVNDVKIRRDQTTGTEVMISEFGSACYNAIPLNKELKDALSESIGVSELQIQELKGFSIKTHQGTGIQYLMKAGEEGRGGKILIRSGADQAAFDRLTEQYAAKYPNLINDPMAASIYADLEIRGLAQHTPNGIITMGFDSLIYHDNSDTKRNWGITFYGNQKGYEAMMEWFEGNRHDLGSLERIKSWKGAFGKLGSYERIWSKEEERQGYLNS